MEVLGIYGYYYNEERVRIGPCCRSSNFQNSLRRKHKVKRISRRSIVSMILLVMLMLSTTGMAAAKPAAPVNIQILNVSDWHGQLDPVSVTGVGNVGGASVLKAYFDQHRAANPNTLTLTAGDAIGATPPLSGFFKDEPSIRAMRLMGFNADTLGNHNFDAGLARLQSQINLAGDTTGTIPGTAFNYLSANLKNVNNNLVGIDKMKIYNVGGVK